MFRQAVNQCRVAVAIEPQGPVLIKSGAASVTGPDDAFVTTKYGAGPTGQPQVFMPGSSLKGVFRSHAERIARTLNPALACDPFSQTSCGRRLQSDAPPQAYRDSCPICRLFGSSAMRGRLAIRDAYLRPGTPAPTPETRDGVGIDRVTGGSSRGAKFDFQVITSGIFDTEIVVDNFETWQLGLLAYLLRDLADGIVQIGSGKSRGLGWVTGRVISLEIHYFGTPAGWSPPELQKLWGIGAFAQGAERYGLDSDDWVELSSPLTMERCGIRWVGRIVDAEGLHSFWDSLGPAWDGYVARKSA